MVNECIGLLYEYLVHVGFLPRLSDSNSNIKKGENTMTINDNDKAVAAVAAPAASSKKSYKKRDPIWEQRSLAIR